jgi:2-oxoisovalerate dehydrogenase E1 component alpha subunit
MRAELRESVINEPDVDVAEVFDTVYHRITPDLARQRDELAAELAREA